MYTEELTRTQEAALTANGTYSEILEHWSNYQPEITERQLGINPTQLDTVRLDRLRIFGGHKLLVMDETVQPSNNFKYNGLSAALHHNLTEHPGLRKIYIGSAGNAGAALVAAAGFYNNKLEFSGYDSRRLEVVVETPTDLVEMKRTLLTSDFSAVNAVHASVEAATAVAKQKAEDDPDGIFIHAYDDPAAIAGQGFVAKRAFRSLLNMEAAGAINLSENRVKILIQRGGGSLLTGFACELYNLKQQGILGDTVQLYQVRPEESLQHYDGLRVTMPGSYAQTVIDDPEFVAGTIHIQDQHTSKAVHAMGHTYHKRFEPSGLAGIAGFYKEQAVDDPTIYVTVLSGANYSSKAYDYFKDLPRRKETEFLGSLTSREYVDVDTTTQLTSPQGLNPCTYGRYPSSK